MYVRPSVYRGRSAGKGASSVLGGPWKTATQTLPLYRLHPPLSLGSLLLTFKYFWVAPFYLKIMELQARKKFSR